MSTKLTWVCFGNHSGYSQAAQDMVLALSDTGRYDIRVEFIWGKALPQSGMSEGRNDFFKSLVAKPRTKEHINVYHCIPISQHKVQRSVRSVGVATFETFQPPSAGSLAWHKILNKNTAVMVPSRFNESIFAHEPLEKPIFYVPHCLDMDKYHPDIEPIEHREKFTFLFFGSWKDRKNYAGLIEGYLNEFTSRDDVQLLIKTTTTGTAKKFIWSYAKRHGVDLKKAAPIEFEERVLNEEQLPRFMKSVDCLVSPTMGEGFGLPGLQCMAVGTPVIVTNFSGVQDYANKDTAILLEPRGFVLKRMLDHVPQFENKKWAFLSAEDIGKKMRYAYDSRETILPPLARRAREYVAGKFSYHASAEKFGKMIDYVENA